MAMAVAEVAAAVEAAAVAEVSAVAEPAAVDEGVSEYAPWKMDTGAAAMIKKATTNERPNRAGVQNGFGEPHKRR